MVSVLPLPLCQDFCPFAQRAWIAFLEKESDPTQPTLFNYTEVNFFNPDLSETKRFLAVHNTVPAAITSEGETLRESMPIAYWVDAQYPKVSPLQPASAEGVATMKALIAKYTGGRFDVVAPFYGALMEIDDQHKIQALMNALLDSYKEISRDLQASGGPYLMGGQFTLADVALIPFVLRALSILAFYKGFSVPDSPAFQPFKDWVAAFSARPSVRISNADRLPRSMAVQPFAQQQRDAYLNEVYACYASGVRDIVRKQLRHAPPGVATQDIQLAVAQKKAQADRAAAQVRHNRMLQGVAILAFATLAAAKLWQWNKTKQ